MSKARNLSLLSTVEAGATTDQTKADIDALGINRGRKNLIINGGMQAWQRATSASAIGYTSVDRWSYYAGSSLAISRSTDVPTGFQYATSVGGGGSDSGLTQKIEASSCKQLVGTTITVSFYLKQTTGAGTDKIAVALARANSEDNFGGTTSISTQTVSTTTSYARYTCTFTSLPTEVSNGLQLSIKSNGAGSVVYLITGVQLEVGSTATDFEHRSYGEELALCQRYYSRTSALSGLSGAAVFNGFDANESWGGVFFPATMRTTPTITVYNNVGTAGGIHKIGSPDLTGVTVGRISTIGFSQITKTGALAAGAIYGCNYTAEAEL